MLAEPELGCQFSSKVGNHPREPYESKGLPRVAQVAIRLRAIDGGTDGIAVADGDAFGRHSGELSERLLVGEKFCSQLGCGPLRGGRLAEDLAHVLVKIGDDEEGVLPVALLSKPLVGLLWSGRARRTDIPRSCPGPPSRHACERRGWAAPLADRRGRPRGTRRYAGPPRYGSSVLGRPSSARDVARTSDPVKGKRWPHS